MKAAVWHARRDLRVDDVPEPPPPPPGQVKVEIAWCGICGTDLHEYTGGPVYIPAARPHPLTGVQAPVVLGHEASGRIVETGSRVTRIKVGDRVALCPIIGCRECSWCRDGLMGLCPKSAYLGSSWHGGAFSRWVNVYDFNCYKLLPEVSDEAGALIEPFAATFRAVRQARVQAGDSVAVVGAGPIGLLAVQAARIAGAGVLVAVEPSAGRRERALQCGATAAIDPTVGDAVQTLGELTNGAGADVVIECGGVSMTGLLAGRLARRKGRVVIMGVHEHPNPVDFTDIVFGEKTLLGSMGGYGVFDEAIAQVAAGNLRTEPLITGRIAVDDIVRRGFEALLQEKDRHAKILVSPT